MPDPEEIKRMEPPASGVRVRMYRQGHGDCFLLAFPAAAGHDRDVVYVLIDCGYKYKSEIHGQKIDTVIEHIIGSTGGRVDVCVVTHEHQDHVNGFMKKKRRKRMFDGLEIGKLWLAWTEDPDDEYANHLRDKYNDALIGLAMAEGQFGAANRDDETLALITELLELELGDDEDEDEVGKERERKPGEAGKDVRAAHKRSRNRQQGLALAGHNGFALKGKTNKRAMRYLEGRANRNDGIAYLEPGGETIHVPNARDVRVYPLGPPRDNDLLLDLDPEGTEQFHIGPMGLSGPEQSFLAAASALESDAETAPEPFARRYVYRADKIQRRRRPRLTADTEKQRVAKPEDYLRVAYGPTKQKSFAPDEPNPDGEDWRRIDGDWLDSAGALALRLNNEVNNTSLVLAFELPGTRKVLLFTGDAQRGNWLSWSDLSWDVDGNEVTARDLLGRCTFYKAGHHGSHNATLNGTETDTYANVEWLGRGAYAKDFVAMIPANTAWATGKSRPWEHPLPEIEEALRAKARGRVFRSDIDKVSRTRDVPADERMTEAQWKRQFDDLATEEDLYFEYDVTD